MKTELEQKIHEFAEQMYKAGYEDRCLLTDEECLADQKRQYEKGLNDAWECARKTVCDKKFSYEVLEQIFGTASFRTIFATNSASEAIAKIKEYEEKQKQTDDEIKVGDEVQSNYANGDKYIVTALECPHYHSCYACLGGKRVLKTEVHKTGRHFPQIAEVLNQMKEEQ